MYHGNIIGVVVPAYNEEQFIEQVIETIPEFVDRIYVIDDHSTDETWRKVRDYVARANKRTLVPFVPDGGNQGRQRVVPIRHSTNRGRGAAVKNGYERALADGVDIVVVMDGDGQMDPAILSTLVDPVADGTADYAVGDRLAGPSHWRGMPTWRLFGNLLLSGLTRIASGYWHIRDPQNGYTAISAATLSDIGVERLYNQYGFLNDLLVKLNVAEKRVTTVSMDAQYGDEKSSIRYTTFVPGLSFLLLKDFLWRLRVRYLSSEVHPIAVLYAVGVVGFVTGAVQLGRRLTSRNRPDRYGFVGLLGGIASLVGAMLLDKHENEGLEAAVEPPESDEQKLPTDSIESDRDGR
ncbi:glycosyltransferase (plasmid) [Haloferax mediterranei ATCC 33500]|uniref:Dolichyl-phosphate beta-D-mannosyltransferase n=1 Tax=Haloferax mediterranei (strain ATCC 33500 / DSM 1411 / JCM 8866 / NBRC 14739 / NCIMB 2177 / R-4) TaxID=523841 RepID=I3RAS8_HALMT|nr:glycosyltransferase family 2 protein [Haloferax mediterranei]AFK21338.1 dolichyl-phosphate beta-D-mannosyltransferase [Haloferax mediterranei ATCC 33500]AHZ24578.1 family 2 glycosyl transferase [Haloferax mediterranei ATCC 33500]ELZ97335.1 dolichyl-phosphate beta-D-mannosyltransferase [Haloferax mediterranei ATCC 33500]MDX5990368.1 glycosyltransferase family 2 protein [Haloferax mediterranei ATCC 33500]QCQ76972.1 glycosyltransferase [Haloferax mediterranei ATCC 33500]